MRTRSLCLIVPLALTAAATAQPTALTYQGRLKAGAQTATGLHDMRFRLFDAASGGTQLGTTQCGDNVQVTDGIFTAQIDFGQQFAAPAQRFLEIEVRADTGLNCSNTTGFVVLSPRQPLTAAPIANHAKSAFALDAADGSPANAVFVDNNGNVGIGTTAPQAVLDIRASNTGPLPGEGARIQGATPTIANMAYMSFLNGSGTPIGYVGDGSTGDNTVFLGAYVGDACLITPGGRVLTATAGGKVGIGTQSPYFRLTTEASFPSDGVGVIGSAPNAPAFSLGASGHGTSYLGMATNNFDFSSDAAPGDLVLLSPVGKRLLLQNGNAGSPMAIVAGNVGIGTATPQAKLDVAGTARVQVLQITGADLAEKFPASEKLEPGMVVSIDTAHAGRLCLSRGAYNTCVAGVVSGANNFSVGAVLGNLPGHEDAPAIALSGRVYVYCDASAGSIKPGDLLTTSDTPGHAMKAADRDRSHGAVIGKAMTPLKDGRGLVLVLVNLQ